MSNAERRSRFQPTDIARKLDHRHKKGKGEVVVNQSLPGARAEGKSTVDPETAALMNVLAAKIRDRATQVPEKEIEDMTINNDHIPESTDQLEE
jgi:hypothetical protein